MAIKNDSVEQKCYQDYLVAKYVTLAKTLKTLPGTVLRLCLMLGVMLCMGVSASAEETKTGYGVTINGTETL